MSNIRSCMTSRLNNSIVSRALYSCVSHNLEPQNKLNFSSLPHGHNNNLYLPSRQGLCDFMSLGSQFIGDINFDLLFNWGHWVRIILKMKVGTMPQPLLGHKCFTIFPAPSFEIASLLYRNGERDPPFFSICQDSGLRNFA